jgi:DNA replication initiation complex subunit (GINS family)
MKLKIRIDDEKTRALWETAKKAKAEVESWPAWKHNEVPRAPSDASPTDETAESTDDRG